VARSPPGRAFAGHHHLPRRPAAQPGDGRLCGDERRGGAIGLLAGDLLTAYASWRWVLFVNVPIGTGDVDAERAG